MTEICKSINALSIIKFIIRNTKPDENEIKLIFVGARPTNIKNILTKIEKNNKLTINEHKELESVIPFYQKKFGNITNYNVFFIYKYIEENISIFHTRIIIYETIRETIRGKLGKSINIEEYYPDNMLLYKYARNMDYKEYVNLLNYIFEDMLELDNNSFFTKLFKITLLNKEELNNKIIEILPIKYKSFQNQKHIELIPFLKQEKYTYENCLNNDEIFHLFLNIPIILSQKYIYMLGNIKYIYYGYQNIEHFINLSKSGKTHNINKDDSKIKELESKFVIESNIISSNDEYLYLNLEFYNKTLNNEYYIITQKELKQVLSSKSVLEYYFPEIDHKTKGIELEMIHNKFKLTTINKQIYHDDIFNITDCFCRNIIFESLSDKLQTKYELANLYNNLNTNYWCPVIKYISNGEPKYIKLNKQFMLNHSYLETNRLIINTDILKGTSKFTLPNMDFIQYKWRISKTEILTVNFYENGYSTVYFDDDNNLKIGKTLFQYLKLVGVTIKTFKKIINAKNLKLPNISNVFNENAETVNYSKLLRGNITIHGKLDIAKLQTKEESQRNPVVLDVKLLINRMRRYFHLFHHFVVSRSITTNTLKFFYKQVNNFYCDRSIANFLHSSLPNTDGNGYENFKNDKKLIDKLINNANYIFYKPEEQIRTILDNLENFNIKSNEKLLYGIEVELKITPDGNIDINIENIDKYYNVRLILFYIKCLLSQIAHDIETGIIDDINDKDKSMLTKIHSVPKGGISKKTRASAIDSASAGKNYSKIRDVDYDEFGIDLDIGDDLLDIDIDIDIGDITLDNVKSDIEIDYDLDLKELSRLVQLEQEAAVGGKDESESSTLSKEEEFKNIDLVKIFGKNKKITFTEYMKQMRKIHDKALFEPDTGGSKKYQYSRECLATPMKQPYIVTERDIASYDDPEAFNGYLKYRGKYYICPRIWDYKANKPISVRKFIENGLKSPYTKGTYIPPEKRGDVELDDKYTVIIRKPPTGSEWEEHNKYPNWPEVLKRTEKEAYPYLMDDKKHPQKLCVPCCGSKKPNDFDPNKKEIQQILKPIASKSCIQKYEEDLSQHDNKDKDKKDNNHALLCTDTMEYFYITNETSNIEKCRFGLIPKNLDIMLNNHQNLFLKNQNQLLDNSNLFLRIGIEHNKKENILETFSVVSGVALAGFKKLIIDKLTPEVFVSLNNGELIDIYASNNILPNSLTDYDRFGKFMEQYQLFFNILDIDYNILERLKYKDIELLNIHIEDDSKIKNYINNAIQESTKDGKDGKDGTKQDDDLINLKKTIIAYKIYSAFYNYIGHILDDNEYKNYTHFLDLFSQSIEWLNPEGLNILIFDKNGSKMMCNPYNDVHRSKFVILIQEEQFHFVPVVHITSTNKGKKIWHGIFQYNKVNVNEHTYNYFEKKVANKKLLELTRARDSNLLNLTILHSSICKYQYINQTYELIKEFDNNDIKIINQIAFTTTQIEFIKLEEAYSYLVLPIYPMAISARKLNIKFKLLESTDLSNIIDYIIIKPLLKNKLAHFGYKISKIYYDEHTEVINSIQFNNNLIVPIQHLEYNIANKNKIIEAMINEGELKGRDDTRIPTLFRPIYFNFQLELSPAKDILNLRNSIYKDFIYNYFKYDFSRILQENNNRNFKDDIIEKISKFNKSDSKFQNVIDNVIDDIMKIMTSRIANRSLSKTTNKTTDNTGIDINKNTESYIKLKVCAKTKKAQGKCEGRFCAYNEASKQCFLDMNPKQLEYFAYLLANDLMNNKVEFQEIIKGSFIPEFNMRNKIFRNPDEIIINVSELAGIIEKGIYSRYKQNITLNEFLEMQNEYIFNKDDYALLTKTNLEEFKKIMNTVIPELVDLSIKNIYMDDKVFTTPFDKTGTYDHTSNLGQCIFPFFDKNKKKFVYQCVPKSGGLMCPTKVDFQRKPDKWGYCPEKIEETRKTLNVIDIETVGGDDYHVGKCNFPFINKTHKNKDGDRKDGDGKDGDGKDGDGKDGDGKDGDGKDWDGKDGD
jgi:hypothetical protein